MAERSFAGMKAIRDRVAASSAARNPADLRKGDEFFVLGFTVSDGVALRASGVFEYAEGNKFRVHRDGEDGAATMTGPQLGFFPLNTRSSMLVIVATLAGIEVDADTRSEVARTAAIARTPCPCGTVRGDGSRCQEWPDCVIP